MTLIDKVLKENSEFPEIDPDDLEAVESTVDYILDSAGASHVYNAKVVPYGPGVKVVLTPNENFAINIENGLDKRLVNELGWEKLDSEMDDKGNFILYYR